MKKKPHVFYGLLLLIASITFEGKTATKFFKITNLVVPNPGDRAAVELAISEFETNVNANLPTIDSSDLTRDTVNSNIISNKGLGVDYTNSMKSFMVGWSQGASANLGSGENILSGARTIKGFGMTTQFNLGLNFEPLKKRKLVNLPTIWGIDLNKTKIYMGLMKGNTSQKVSGYTLGFDLFSLNLRLMTKIKKAENFKNFFFKWGGIDLSTGLETNKTILSVSVPRNDTIPDASNTLETNFNGNVGFSVTSSSYSVPLDVSASACFFSFIDLFWGLGADLNFGHGEGVSTSDSDVIIRTVAAPKNQIATADAEFNLGTRGSPSFFNARWFTGAQINLWKMKVALQAQHSIIKGIWGFGANFNFIF